MLELVYEIAYCRIVVGQDAQFAGTPLGATGFITCGLAECDMDALIATSMQRRPNVITLAIRADDNNGLSLEFHADPFAVEK
ncbi:hypothetical protein [Paraburkholderia metrosideri]|uniref:hypothetical protein n=1 Tax=Paraburkholderia metrosideri TaxID=580937 RepID=UPI001918522E|nr:hypothetical protein [Paraburkholderia metrosideri]